MSRYESGDKINTDASVVKVREFRSYQMMLQQFSQYCHFLSFEMHCNR